MSVFLTLLYFLIGLFLFLIIREVIHNRRQSYRAAKQIAGAPIYPFIGNLYEVLFMNAAQTFTHLRDKANLLKRTYRHWVIGRLMLNIIRAKDAEVVLNSSVNIDKNMIYELVRPLMGDGLLLNTGQKWQKRRRILTPAFHFNILQQFYGVFKEESDNFINLLKPEVHKKEGTELQSFISRFTLNTICETAMGVKLDSLREPDEYRKSVYSIGHLVVHRLVRPWLHNDLLYTVLGYRRHLDKVLEPVRLFTKNIIKQRREEFHKNTITIESYSDENIYETKKKRYAMLDTLIAAEAKNQIDGEGIQEEVDTFMFEGHDTTSSGLVFTLWLLAMHQEAQDRIFEEIKQLTMEKNGEEFTTQDYVNMKYFDRVLKESLRLYPPVPFIGRQSTQDMIIDDVLIPVDSLINIHVYDQHRDPEQFPDPEKFDPDRFLPEIAATRHPYAYIPFSAGPRNCIGQKFAVLEMKTLITKILFNYHLTPITQKEDITFIADIVLRTKEPIKVKFNLRN